MTQAPLPDPTLIDTAKSAPALGRFTRMHWVLAWCSVLIGAFILVFNIHRNGFWADELYTLHAINLPTYEMVMERLRRGHFPLYFLLLKQSLALLHLPHTEAALRGSSIILYAGALLTFAAYVRRLLPGPSAAVAVTLLALNGVVMRQSAEVRMYGLLLGLNVGIFAFYRGFLLAQSAEMTKEAQAAARRMHVAFVTCVAAAFWTSSAAFLPMLGYGVDAWQRRRTHPAALRMFLLSGLLVALSLAPLITIHLMIRDRAEMAGTPHLNVLMNFVAVLGGVLLREDYFDTNTLLRILFVISVILTVGISATIVARWRGRTLEQQIASSVVFTAFAFMVGTAISNPILGNAPIGPARYLTGILPCAVILVAALWPVTTPRGWAVWLWDKRGLLAHLAVTLYLSANAWGIVTVRTEPFRELVADLRAKVQPQDGILVMPHEALDGVLMYAPELTIDAGVDRYGSPTPTLLATLKRLQSKDQVWMLLYRPKEGDNLTKVLEMLGPYTSSSKKKGLGKLRIFQFAPIKARP